MTKRPRRNSISATAASSTWAAICRPCSMTLSLAATIAVPLAISDFEPPVPPPAISSSLSPCNRRMRVERDAELLVQDLRERGPVALAVIERAGDDGDTAIGFEADAAHLVGRRPGHFEIVADAAAAQQAAPAAFLLAGGKPVPVGLRQRLIEHGGELAAVIGRAVRRLVRHRVFGDVVAAAQLDLVDAHLGGGGVDQPLHVVIALGAAGAAIGADRRRVGDDDPGRDLDQRRLVDADRVLDRVGGRRAAAPRPT